MMKERNFGKIVNESFLILFMILLVFFANKKNELDQRIAVFAINGNKHILAAILLVVVFGLICVNKKNIKVDIVAKLLIIRFVLYLIPCLFVNESSELQIGFIMAVLCSVMAYIVGRENDCSDEFIALVMGAFAIIIALQIFITALIRGVGINSSNLKWWMVIPIGQTNTIGTYFLPMFILVDGLQNTKSGIYRTIFIAIEVLLVASVFFMGSRSTLILLIAYLAVRYLILSRISRAVAIKLLIALPIVLVAVIIFSQDIGAIFKFISQFNLNSLMYTRIRVYQESWDIFCKHIILGRGAYAYEAYDAVMAHNFILESLVENGIIGTVPFLVALILSLKELKSVKRFQNAYFYVVVFILIKSSIEPTFYSATFEIFFWLLVGLGIRKENAEESQY